MDGSSGSSCSNGDSGRSISGVIGGCGNDSSSGGSGGGSSAGTVLNEKINFLLKTMGDYQNWDERYIGYRSTHT
jgi:hypothetical protein